MLNALLVCIVVCGGLVEANDFLAIGYDETSNKMFASVSSMSLDTGETNFGTASETYSIDSSLQPCINAAFPMSDNMIAYAIQTYDGTSYAFDVVNENGTVAHRQYRENGKPVSFLAVSWSYSTRLKSLVGIGWRDDMTPSNLLNHKKQGKNMRHVSSSFSPVEIFLVSPMTGEVAALVSVPGYAFLECASATANDWFHYMYEDESQAQYTMSVNLVTRKLYSVRVPINLFGMVLNFIVEDPTSSTFYVVTEQGTIHEIQPELQHCSLPIRIIDSSKFGKIQLSFSIWENSSIYTMLGDNLGVSSMSNFTFKALPLHKDLYTVGFWNLN